MIRYLSNHFKLRQRIYTGYFIVGMAILAVILIVSIAFFKITNDFRDFVAFSNKAHIELLLTGRVSEIQRQAVIYTYEGHQSSAALVNSLYENIHEQITKSFWKEQPQLASTLAIIKLHLENYHAVFLQVQQQRVLQQRLINVEFYNNAIEIEQLIRRLIKQINNSATSELGLEVIFNTFLLAEKDASRYFDSLDSEFVTAAKKNLREVSMGLASMDIEEGPVREIVHQAIDKLDQYEQSFIEAVQRTRSNLYLINVVMAAEAYEILYQSRRLSALITDQMNAKEQVIFANMNEVLNGLIVFGAVLLILLIVFSYGIGQSIAMPITRLTRTFRELAQGSNDAGIPEYSASDEFSELTQAAVAFRDKNVQTERLLQQSTELTQALEKNKRDLERSNDELEQFVYTVSHDLKSPLVTNMGFISIIRRLADQGKYEEAIGKLDKIVNSTERMGQLIDDLLELCRIGRIDFDRKMIDLNSLCGQFAQSQSEWLSTVRFSLIIKQDLPKIYGNESRILQIFENILNNAVKHAYNPEQTPRLEIGAMSRDDYVLLYCRDNGPGIESAFHQKIFGLFYRLDTQHGGHGIGLAIVKKIMRYHGGDIWVESLPNQGATFWLKFPEPNKEMERVKHDL